MEHSKVWDLEGYYLVQALMLYILILSPRKLILGGVVMKQQKVFASIYKHLPKVINNYITLPDFTPYIVGPDLGDNAGTSGALILAQQAFDESK